MRLYYSPASPFAAKARMAASHCGIAIDAVKTDTSAEPGELLKANPLGKIPALVLDDGQTIFDSGVICDYFDRISGNQLQPQTVEAWRTAKVFEAAADGTMEALILVLYEARYRPEGMRHKPWTDMQMRKADRSLDYLEAHLDGIGEAVTIAHFALAALIGWMAIRFDGKIAGEHPKLQAWIEAFPERFPAYEQLKPQVS